MFKHQIFNNKYTSIILSSFWLRLNMLIIGSCKHVTNSCTKITQKLIEFFLSLQLVYVWKIFAVVANRTQHIMVQASAVSGAYQRKNGEISCQWTSDSKYYFCKHDLLNWFFIYIYIFFPFPLPLLSIIFNTKFLLNKLIRIRIDK